MHIIIFRSIFYFFILFENREFRKLIYIYESRTENDVYGYKQNAARRQR